MCSRILRASIFVGHDVIRAGDLQTFACPMEQLTTNQPFPYHPGMVLLYIYRHSLLCVLQMDVVSNNHNHKHYIYILLFPLRKYTHKKIVWDEQVE